MLDQLKKMKTFDGLREQLKKLSEGALGFDLNDYEQGSEEWKLARLGVISASNVWKVIKQGRKKGSYSDQRLTYMYELIAEIATGKSKEISGMVLDWGTNNESEARDTYGAPVDEIPFIYSDCMRYGYSPDGLTANGLIEIKCPYNTENHLKTVFDGHIKPEYVAQMQYGMWFTGRDHCDFISYDPRIKNTTNICVMTIEKDQEMHETFDREIPIFIKEMDDLLEKLGLEFGQQWEPEL